MNMRQSVNVDMQFPAWRVVNDSVMGGVSYSEVVPTENGVRFQGRLSLENDGGFASMRRTFSGSLEGVQAIRLRIFGDGRRYQFRIRLLEDPAGVSWRTPIETDGSWQTVHLALANFERVFHGKPVPGAAPVIAGSICHLGFLLADRTQAPFTLDVAAIEFLCGQSNEYE